MKPESEVGESSRGKKKTRGPKKKTKKDPNEPQKPISAYALFFRDTQTVIKRQNPNATFGEVSQIVASMWESLEVSAKNVYKEKNEAAKKEYQKALAAYRASLTETTELSNGKGPSTSLEPSTLTATSFIESSSPPQVIELSPPPPPPPANSLTSTVQEGMSNLTVETPVKSPEASVTNETYPPAVTTISSSEEQDVNEESEPNMSNGTATMEVRICLRSGCTNPAIESPEWDQEYCSSKCVVEHCSNVFMAHVAERNKVKPPKA